MVKKQTVWLLTMLSLVVVLSVYYVTTPDSPPTNPVTTPMKEGKEAAKEQGASEKTNAKEEKETVFGTGDDYFAQLRLNLTEKRDEMKERLQEVMGSASVSAEKKNEAYDQLQELDNVEAKEAVLETLIKTNGYKEVLVRADGEEVRITVKAQKSSAKEANKIIQLVRGELGTKNVAVQFEPIQ
ncbi:SpoIIIAH-like family protein [Bacillus sp. 165]|uniref:SpoIIIAH-like family protein n=1 Tax=Bacillus sp. 165 TaxID=1529117 RepID=UPI001ADC4E14|nr:SpoIIIAH-like family protein [Bacillus sp. 165]MBO9129706.1 SpoIIIAH-like family protein [Bacillus sp. 165]